MDERRDIDCGHITVRHSHLFPGVKLHADAHADQYEVHFSDGAHTEAAILPDDGPGVLDVVGYHTTAGTVLPGRIWTIRSIEETDSGLQITLGPAVP
ncbi:hypothetical protein ACFO5K_05410 [Nocardia halotolerans]|uniref:Uncharacterized protein n=1 Tax=Nocardia halotolerans TaxID=1755878 RepID=A0ABV8VCT9_9NOCA